MALSDALLPDERAPDERSTDGRDPNGRDPNGRAADEHAADEHATDKHAADERALYAVESHLLHTVTLAATAVEDLHFALGVALREICDNTGWAYGEAWIPRPDGSALVASPAWYSRAPGLEAFRQASTAQSFAPDQGLPGRAWAAKQPLWLTDVSSEPALPRQAAARAAGLHTALAIPILSGETVSAVMAFFTFETREEDEHLVLLISTVAAQFGTILARKRAEEALRESEQRFRTLVNSMDDIVYTLDRDQRHVGVYGRWLDKLGLKAADFLGKTAREFFGLERAVPHEEANLRALAGETVVYEWSAEQPDGMHYFQTSLSPLYDARGTVTGIVGVGRDITVHRRTEEFMEHTNLKLAGWVTELEQRTHEMALLAEMGDLLQACFTAEEAYAVVAQGVQRLFPNEAGVVCVLNPARSLVEAVAAWGEARGERVFTPGECWALRRGRTHLVEDATTGLLCRHAAGATSSYLCVPMMAQGEALGLLHLQASTQKPDAPLAEPRQRLAATVAEHVALALANLKLQETLRAQAIRDPLTGLFNRRYMEESLERELRRAARHGAPLGIIALDLDRFKRVNDTYGHPAGDALLRAVGNFLQSHIRAEDIACRSGGEEFVLVLPDASFGATVLRAEQILKELRQLETDYRGQRIANVTLSAGVAAFPEHGTTGEGVLRAADAALYRAKRAGRDRVETVQSGD